jgi:hypothetical protein
MVLFMVGLCWLTHFQRYFSTMVEVSFIGGGNRSTQWKPPTCRKSLTDLIAYCCMNGSLLEKMITLPKRRSAKRIHHGQLNIFQTYLIKLEFSTFTVKSIKLLIESPFIQIFHSHCTYNTKHFRVILVWRTS